MIPRNLFHVWIGPYKPPLAWMDTWPKKHPAWEYTVLDNDALYKTPWRLQKHIDEYISRGSYSGVADLIRYEALYKYGGFVAPADSVSIKPVDDLFDDKIAYTVCENDIFCPNSMSPVLASPPKSPALEIIISSIENLEPRQMGEPWTTTGNLLVGYLVRKYPNYFCVLPSRTFVPQHYSGLYQLHGTDTYAEQYFGTGSNGYDRSIDGFFRRKRIKKTERMRKTYRERSAKQFDPVNIPWLDMSAWV